MVKSVDHVDHPDHAVAQYCAMRRGSRPAGGVQDEPRLEGHRLVRVSVRMLPATWWRPHPGHRFFRGWQPAGDSRPGVALASGWEMRDHMTTMRQRK